MGNLNHVFLVSLYFKAAKRYFIELFPCLKSFSKMFFLEIEVNILPRENNPQAPRTRFSPKSQVLDFAEGIQFNKLLLYPPEELQKSAQRAMWESLPLPLGGATEFSFFPSGNTGFLEVTFS